MTSLSQLLIASLLMGGTDRNGDRRGNMFSTTGEAEDLRAARERAKKRS